MLPVLKWMFIKNKGNCIINVNIIIYKEVLLHWVRYLGQQSQIFPQLRINKVKGKIGDSLNKETLVWKPDINTEKTLRSKEDQESDTTKTRLPDTSQRLLSLQDWIKIVQKIFAIPTHVVLSVKTLKCYLQSVKPAQLPWAWNSPPSLVECSPDGTQLSAEEWHQTQHLRKYVDFVNITNL